MNINPESSAGFVYKQQNNQGDPEILLVEINRLKLTNYKLLEEIEDLKHREDISTGNQSENQLEILRQKVTELEDEKSNLNRDLDFWKERFEKDSQLRLKLHDLEDKLSTDSKDINSQLSTQLADHITLNPEAFERLNEIETLKKENVDLLQKVQSAEEELGLLKSFREENVHLQNQLDERYGEEKDLKTRLEEYERKSDVLFDIREQAETLTVELECIRELLQDNKILKLVHQEKGEERVWVDVNKIDGNDMRELTDVRKKIIELIAANKSLVKAIKEKDSETEDFSRTASELIPGRDEIEKVVARLSEELVDKCKEVDALETKVASYEASLKRLGEENQKFKIDLKQLREASNLEKGLVQRADHTHFKLRDQRIADLEKDKQRLYLENDKLKRELLDYKMSEEKPIEEDLRPTVTSLYGEIAKLTNLLREKDAEVMRLQRNLEEQPLVETGQTELHEEINRLGFENERMTSLLEEKERELNSLMKKSFFSTDIKTKFEAMIIERTNLKEERDRLAGNVFEKGVELEKLKLKLRKAEDFCSENKKLEETLAERNRQINHLEAHFEHLEIKLAKREEGIQSLTAESASYQKKIDYLTQLNEGFRSNLQEMYAERDNLMTIIERKEAEFEEVCAKFDNLQKEHDNLLKEQQRLLDQQEEMKKQLNLTNKEKDELMETLEESEGKISIIREEAGKLESSIQRRLSEDDNIREQLDKMVAENSRLQEVIEGREKKFDDLNLELEDQKEREASFAQALNTEVNSMVARVETLNQECLNLVNEREELLKTIESKDAQISSLSDTFDKLQHNLNLITVELDQKRTCVPEFERKIQEFEEQLSAKEQEMQGLNDYIIELEGLRGEFIEHKSLIEKISAQRDEMLKDLDERNMQLIAQNKDMETLWSTIEAQNTEIKELSHQKGVLGAYVERLEEEASQREQMIEGLVDQLDKVNSGIEISVQRLTNEKDGIVEQLNALTSENERVMQQRDSLKATLSEKETQLANMGKVVESLEEILNMNSVEFERTIRERDERISMLNEDLNQMIAQQEDKRTDPALDSLIESYKQQIIELSSVNIELSQLIVTKDNEISMLTGDLNKLEFEIASKATDSEILKDQLNKLTEENVSLRKVVDNSSQYIDGLNEVNILVVENMNLNQENQEMTLTEPTLAEVKEELNNMVTEQEIINAGEVAPEYNEQIFSLEESLAKLKFELANKTTDCEIFREQLNKLAAENASLREVIDNSYQYIDNLNQKNQELKQEDPTLTEVKEELNNMVVEQEKVTAVEASLQNNEQIFSLEESLGKLKFELANKATDCEILREQLSKLAAENASLREVVANSSQYIDNLNQKSQTNSINAVEPIKTLKEDLLNLEKDIEAFANQINKNGEIILQLGAKMEPLSTHFFEKAPENTDLKSCIAEFEDLKEAIDFLQKDLVQITQDTDCLVQKAREDDSQTTAFMGEVTDLEGTLQGKVAENKQISSRLEKLSTSIDTLQQRIQPANNVSKDVVGGLVCNHSESLKASTDLPGQIESLRLQNKQLREELHHLIFEKDGLIGLLGQKIHEIMSLENKLHIASNDNKSLLQTFENLQLEYDKSASALKKRDIEINGLKGLLDYASAEVETLKERLVGLEIENEKLTLAQKDKDKELYMLRKNTRKDTETTRSQVKEHLESEDRLRESVFNLQQDLLHVINDRDNLLKLLQERESELERLQPMVPLYESLINCLKSADLEISRLNALVLKKERQIREHEALNKSAEDLNQSYEVNEKLSEENSELRRQGQEFIQIIGELEKKYRSLEKGIVEAVSTEEVSKMQNIQYETPEKTRFQEEEESHGLGKHRSFDINFSNEQLGRDSVYKDVHPPQRF